MTEPQQCDVCKEPIGDGHWAEDEDNRVWCVSCRLEWELENGCYWENRQPLRKEMK